ncbi:ABC transporter ATP-binding protein [Methylobacterium ajmalii]|nr:ABC transporter ATP-binding protein [Methylobacterium ajmalii]MBK3400602.1 ABC transporter ATP-binding protein [Methylobacterium ajmalii]MBK3408878.1 ABC transporter ATP-binding protein [Methylobacterium ajmalii]MBK3422324.1 ABC transporter ATP-binding protein [Methylobacterium ajmalii]MBZ6414976.1 ABC transporter ATP-binding protein [Methylobacterium sp.]
MLSIENVTKAYRGRAGSLPVLTRVNLDVRRGELCALTGASGSGKTTLMNLIGLLDRPDEGAIRLDGTDTAALSESDTAGLRNRLIGFVFQSFHLLPRLSALDNVALPLVYRGIARATRRARAAAALERVGLAARAAHHPDEMSGGQRQRVAIARALVGDPPLLLADEPTGNLDSHAADDIMTLFFALNRNLGVTILIVTHDPTIAARCPRRIVMRDGRVLDDNRGALRDAVCAP